MQNRRLEYIKRAGECGEGGLPRVECTEKHKVLCEPRWCAHRRRKLNPPPPPHHPHMTQNTEPVFRTRYRRNIYSWNWVGTKYKTKFGMPNKMLILKAEIDFIFESSPPPALPRINSKTEFILTRNRFCGIDAWGPCMGWVSLTTERMVVGGESSLETGASFENSPLEMYTLTSHYHQDGDGEVQTWARTFKRLRSPGIDSK